MKSPLLWMIVLMFAAAGCKVRTISEGKPPRDGVYKTTRTDFFARQKRDLEAEEHYRDGKMVKLIAWFDNGKTAFEYHTRSETREYDSTISFFRNGRTRVIMVWQDTNRVFYREYYENGFLKTRADSELNEEFFESGQKKLSSTFKNGEIVLVRRWHENGKLKELGEWKNDRRNGKWIEWDTAGNVTRNDLYRDGAFVR